MLTVGNSGENLHQIDHILKIYTSSAVYKAALFFLLVVGKCIFTELCLS